MGVILTVDDLTPFVDIDPTKADAMITDAEALAFRVAPCLADTDQDGNLTAEAGVLAAAKAILRGVVLRWHEQGTASYAAQTAGPPGFPVASPRAQSNNLWTNEEDALQRLCAASSSAAIGTIATTRGGPYSDTIYVPTGPPPSGYPFPWYAADGY